MIKRKDELDIRNTVHPAAPLVQDLLAMRRGIPPEETEGVNICHFCTKDPDKNGSDQADGVCYWRKHGHAPSLGYCLAFTPPSNVAHESDEEGFYELNVKYVGALA